jgi:molecular chaperone GrpE
MQGQDSSDETEDLPPEPIGEEQPTAESTTVYTDAELRAKVDAACADVRDRMLRVAAEYENYRRRVQREKEQWQAEAIERFVGDLLGVLDDFDRALLSKTDSAQALLDGVKLTEKQLRSALGRHGVEVLDPAVGDKFDPKLHEAIQRVPAAAKSPSGSVAVVFEKGYALKGKLLRPARVAVAGDA